MRRTPLTSRQLVEFVPLNELPQDGKASRRFGRPSETPLLGAIELELESRSHLLGVIDFSVAHELIELRARCALQQVQISRLETENKRLYAIASVRAGNDSDEVGLLKQTIETLSARLESWEPKRHPKSPKNYVEVALERGTDLGKRGYQGGDVGLQKR